MNPEHKLSSYVIRICYDIIAEETANQDALERVLQLAGLERFAKQIPPMSNAPAITMGEYEKLIGVVWQVFDPTQAREIFRRVAERGFSKIAHSGVLAFVQFLRAFDAIGGKHERVAMVMGRLTTELSNELGNLHSLRRDGEVFILEIHNCPYCAELVRKNVTSPDQRACHIPVAFYQAAFAWASGSPHTVQETSCRVSSGQDYCQFKIFWNIALKHNG